VEKSRCYNIKVIRNDNGFVIGKYCSRCCEYFDVNSFDWDGSRKGYLLSWCKDCSKDI